MALTVTGFSSTRLSYKIAKESNASDNLNADVFGGAGTLYSAQFDNQSNNAAYIKIYLRSGTVTATGNSGSEPDLLFEVPANEIVDLSLPSGLAFTQLSFWVTDAAATSDAGDPGTVLLSFLCA